MSFAVLWIFESKRQFLDKLLQKVTLKKSFSCFLFAMLCADSIFSHPLNTMPKIAKITMISNKLNARLIFLFKSIL